MKRAVLAALAVAACGPASAPEPEQRYGYVARLGRDTVSVESVSRQGNTLTSDAVDRFPRLRQRHTEITLAPDGGIQRLVMDVHTPSEPAEERDRKVVAEVSGDVVRLSKRDQTGEKKWEFATGGRAAMAHVPQMYSLYELYFAAALRRAAATKPGAEDTLQMRQFYIDREFDNFPLHRGVVRPLPGGKAEIRHDWLSGYGDATLDSSYRLIAYSGTRSTYKVDVRRLTGSSELPDIRAIGERFAALETKNGGMVQLSVRDTTRASIGAAEFTVDYGRPLARGRVLLGDILPYDRVWRTGANAATQFTTSVPITLAGMKVPAGAYTLWTVPRANGATLIVNEQTGQWGTGYDGSKNLGMAPMTTETLAAPVEKFTISIAGTDDRRGTLSMEWGTFRWTAPIDVR